MLSDRISSASVQEADDLFSWNAHVIRDRHVSYAVWRVLFVRSTKYNLDERKIFEILVWISANLKLTSSHLHDGQHVVASFLALVCSVTDSAMLCPSLVSSIASPALCPTLDFRSDDIAVEESLQTLCNHAMLCRQSNVYGSSVRHLFAEVNNRSMDQHFLAKLSLAHWSDGLMQRRDKTEMAKRLEQELIPFAENTADRHSIKSACLKLLVEVGLAGCGAASADVVQPMGNSLLQIRSSLEGTFSRRNGRAIETLESLHTLQHVLSVVRMLQDHTSEDLLGFSESKSLATCLVRNAEQFDPYPANDGSMIDEFSQAASKVDIETCNQIMPAIANLLMSTACLLLRSDQDTSSVNTICDSLVNIVVTEMTDRCFLVCLKCLDPKFARFEVLVEMTLEYICEVAGDVARRTVVGWADCVMEACHFLYTSCTQFIKALNEPKLQKLLRIFRLLQPTQDKSAFSVRALTRHGRRLFADCFHLLMTHVSTSDLKFCILDEVMDLSGSGTQCGVGDTMLNLLKDPDFGVRAHMSNVITVLCDVCNEQDVIESIEDFVPIAGSVECKFTTILTLGQLAIACELLESDLLFVIINLVRGKDENDDMFCLVQDTVSKVSRQRGYSSAAALSSWHMHRWLRLWTQLPSDVPPRRRFSCLNGMKKSLPMFPHKACGFDSIENFFAKHRGIILLETTLSGDADTYIQLTQTVRREIATEVSELYPYLFAQYTLAGIEHSRSTEAMDGFLSSKFASYGNIDTQKLLKRSSREILLHMFATVCPNKSTASHTDDGNTTISYDACGHALSQSWVAHLPTQRPSDFSTDVLKIALQQKVNNLIKWLQDDGVGAEVVAIIHEDLCDNFNRLAFKLNRLCALFSCVELMGNRSIEPYVHRYIVHICLQHIKMHKLRDLCVAILHKASKVDLLHNRGENVVLHIKNILSAMASTAPSNGPDLQCSVYVACVVSFVGIHNDAIHDALQAIEHLNWHLQMNEVNTAQFNKIKQMRSCSNAFEAELSKFVSDNGADSTAQLQHLAQFLHDNACSGATKFSVSKQSTHIVSQCIWKLINMCSSGNQQSTTGHTSIEKLVSVCLGGLGPVHSNLIAFSSYRTGPSDGDGHSPDELARNTRVLILLDSYQLDSDAKVVRTARNTMRAVLDAKACPKGKLALDNLTKLQHPVQPFLDVHKKPRANIICPEFISVDDAAFWTTVNKSYSEWICSLCSACIAYGCNDQVLLRCFELVQFKADFAEYLLPYVISDLISSGGRDGKATEVFSRHIESALGKQKHFHRRAVRLLLRVLNFLRQKRTQEIQKVSGRKGSSSGRRGGGTNIDRPVHFLHVDYLTVARSALSCHAYFTALLYVELHSTQTHGQVVPQDTGGLQLRLHRDLLPESEQLLLQIYLRINEPDGLYGVNNSLNVHHRIQSFEHERNWEGALGAYDTLLQLNTSNAVDGEAHTGLMMSMQKMGYMHLLENYCRGAASASESIAVQEFQYEAAWRACKWDEQLGHQLLERGMPVGFNTSLFKCIQALRAGDEDTFARILDAGRLSVLQDLRATSLESTKSVFSTLSKLQLYVIAEGAMQVSKLSAGKPREARLAAVNDWCRCVTSRVSNIRDTFAFVEPVLALQVSLLEALDCKELVSECLVELASCARKARRFPIAAAALQRLFGAEPCANEEAGLLEEARGLWAQGDDEKAIGLARYLIDSKSTGDRDSIHTALHVQHNMLLSDACRLAGKWMASTRSESSDVIMDRYLQPAIARATELADDQRSLKAKYVLATYSETLFHSLTQTQDVRQQHISSQRQEIQKWLQNKIKESDRESKGLLIIMQKQLKQDEKEYEVTRQRQQMYAECAIEMYTACLTHLKPATGKYDIRVVFKLLSLWFNTHENYPTVNAVIETAITKDRSFPFYKLIPLVYQVVSRLGPSTGTTYLESDFQKVLQELIYRMASAHPHHCLYQIFALQHGDRVARSIRNSKGFVAQDPAKTHAAKEMIERLKHRHSELIEQMSCLLDAYLELSEKPPAVPDDVHKAPVTSKLRGMSELRLVPVTTLELPVEPSGNYDAIVQECYIRGFGKELQYVGGINRPMKICCMSASGQQEYQLLKAMNDKGGDDLRQDAVMEQVFGVANTLLRNNDETRRRALSVRTYKVIPMTPCVGMLQWCNNTMPIGGFLLRGNGAHARYRPHDYKDSECREMMKAVQEGKRQEVRLCFHVVASITDASHVACADGILVILEDMSEFPASVSTLFP
jgi:hypothetical protein